MGKFTKGHAPIERRLTQVDIDRIWEQFFGKKWGLDHIAGEYDVKASVIAAAIDSESARRWKMNHPHETNRERILPE